MAFAGLVAAAGSSSRMGRCKALLPYDDEVSFVERIALCFLDAGLDPVVVTLPEGEDGGRVRARVSHLPVVAAPNVEPKKGLSGSVITALVHAPRASGLVLCPVDAPFLEARLVEELVSALPPGRRAPLAAVPVVEEQGARRRGHPAAFSRPLFELLWSAGDAGGPRAVIEALGEDLLEIPWHDPRVAQDVDTPEDYERLLGRRAR